MNNNTDTDENVATQGTDKILHKLQAAQTQGSERERQVVVRADGTKVIRVKKRRRVYDDDERERKATFKNKLFLVSICVGVLLVVGALAGTFLYRLNAFNTQDFVQKIESQLGEAWGGEVQVRGMAMDGLLLKVSHVEIKFPQESCVDFITLEGVSGELSIAAVLMGKLKGEDLNISRAVIGLRPEATHFTVPKTGVTLPMVFSHYTSPHLEVGFTDPAQPMVIARHQGAFHMQTEAYIRTTHNGADTEYILDTNRQRLRIKGWKTLSVATGSFIFNGSGIKHVTLSGKTDKDWSRNGVKEAGDFMITGAMNTGTKLDYSAWTLTGTNFDISSLIGNDFANFLRIQCGSANTDEVQQLQVEFALPVGKEFVRPPVKGTSGTISKVLINRLPVLGLLVALTENNRDLRLPYGTPMLGSGTLELECNGKGSYAALKQLDVTEQGFLSVIGNVYSDGEKLWGDLVFNVPAYVVDARLLPQGITLEDKMYAIPVKISGTPANPQDSSTGMLQELNNAKRLLQKQPLRPDMNTLTPPPNSKGINTDVFM